MKKFRNERFKEGQKLICVNIDNIVFEEKNGLTLNKIYKVIESTLETQCILLIIMEQVKDILLIDLKCG